VELDVILLDDPNACAREMQMQLEQWIITNSARRCIRDFG
jgi:hypothetical protein